MIAGCKICAMPLHLLAPTHQSFKPRRMRDRLNGTRTDNAHKKGMRAKWCQRMIRISLAARGLYYASYMSLHYVVFICGHSAEPVLSILSKGCIKRRTGHGCTGTKNATLFGWRVIKSPNKKTENGWIMFKQRERRRDTNAIYISHIHICEVVSRVRRLIADNNCMLWFVKYRYKS